jgi:hypothetical protein
MKEVYRAQLYKNQYIFFILNLFFYYIVLRIITRTIFFIMHDFISIFIQVFKSLIIYFKEYQTSIIFVLKKYYIYIVTKK